MGLFGKKSLTEIINKNLSERQIEFEIKDSVISFSINLDNSIKRGESKDLKDFNNKSKYLKALANDNIIYLYYACFVTAENVIFVIDTIISSLQVLENDIINL